MPAKKRKPVPSDTGGTTPRRRRRRVESVLLLIAGLLMLDALVGERGLVAIMRAKEESRALELRLAIERAKGARMRERIRLLNYDADTIEDVARRELGLIVPGEKVFTLKALQPDEP